MDKRSVEGYVINFRCMKVSEHRLVTEKVKEVRRLRKLAKEVTDIKLAKKFGTSVETLRVVVGLRPADYGFKKTTRKRRGFMKLSTNTVLAIHKAYGEKIALVRECRALSCENIAKMVGVSRVTVQRVHKEVAYIENQEAACT